VTAPPLPELAKSPDGKNESDELKIFDEDEDDDSKLPIVKFPAANAIAPPFPDIDIEVANKFGKKNALNKSTDSEDDVEDKPFLTKTSPPADSKITPPSPDVDVDDSEPTFALEEDSDLEDERDSKLSIEI